MLTLRHAARRAAAVAPRRFVRPQSVFALCAGHGRIRPPLHGQTTTVRWRGPTGFSSSSSSTSSSRSSGGWGRRAARRVAGALAVTAVAAVAAVKLSSRWHAHCVASEAGPSSPITTTAAASAGTAAAPAAAAAADALPVPGLLRVLSLNMFLRPWGIADDAADDDKDARLDGFCTRYLDDYDVLCLQECFSTLNTRKARLIRLAAARGFVYHCEAPPPPLLSRRLSDGGLLILSRLPFAAPPEFRSFSCGAGPDALADKGVLHACVRLPARAPGGSGDAGGDGSGSSVRQGGGTGLLQDGRADADDGSGTENRRVQIVATATAANEGDVVHFFTTHLQASYRHADWAAARAQATQLEELRAFVDEKTAGAAGAAAGREDAEGGAAAGRATAAVPVVLCGDFNIDQQLQVGATLPSSDRSSATLCRASVGGLDLQVPASPDPAVQEAARALRATLRLSAHRDAGGRGVGEGDAVGGEFVDLLAAFAGGRHLVTYVEAVNSTTGAFVASNLHHRLPPEEFAGRGLVLRGKSIDAIFLRPAGEAIDAAAATPTAAAPGRGVAHEVPRNTGGGGGGGFFRAVGCKVVELPLKSVPFGRVSDHSGVAAEFCF